MQQNKIIRIGLDASSGDYGELEVCKAVIESIKSGQKAKFYIFGDLDNVVKSFNELKFDYKIDAIKLIDAKDTITMNDHPVFSIRNKKDSSIVKGGMALVSGEIDAFVSAGNTGALVALAQFILKPIDRPVVAAIVPTAKNPMILIDSGCNVDSKPEWLYQYAVLSNAYYKLVFGEDKPRIGLLSVGSEENKGNNLTLAAYKLIQENKKLNFIGNVEARDLVFGVCDVAVTDGFAGNVFLKTYEGTASMLLKVIKEKIKSSFASKIGGLLIKPKLKDALSKYDVKKYGGAPILGSNHLVLKCHGNSKSEGFVNAIDQVYKLVSTGLMDALKASVEV